MPNNRFRRGYSRTINLVHICGHVTPNMIADCFTTADLVRRAKDPCPDCQAKAKHAQDEAAAIQASLNTAIAESTQHVVAPLAGAISDAGAIGAGDGDAADPAETTSTETREGNHEQHEPTTD